VKFHSPLSRLLWRSGVLWDLCVSIIIAALIPRALGPLPFALSGDFAAAKGYELPPLVAEFCIAFLGGSVLGVVASFAWQDLTHCRLSWLLPGLRGKVRRDLFLLAALGAGLAALASLFVTPQLGVLVSAGLALAGFGWGNHLWDPHSSKRGSHLVWSSCLVVVRFSEDLAEFLVARPVFALIGLVPCVLSVLQSTSRAATRRRTLVSRHDLGASFEDYEAGTGFGASHRPAARPRARWHWGRIAVTERWVTALRYEDRGCAGLEWFLRRGLLLGLLQLVCLVAGVVELALPMGAMLMVLFERQDLRNGVHYPLSRAQRARAVWMGARQQGLCFLAWSLAVHPLLVWSKALFLGEAPDFAGVPHFAATALLTAGVLPLLQAVRLHLLEFHRGVVTTLRFGTTLLCASLIFCIGTLWIDHHLRELEVGIHFVLVLPVLFLVPYSFRQHLSEWYRRADLI
jgi:hypothetical protein